MDHLWDWLLGLGLIAVSVIAVIMILTSPGRRPPGKHVQRRKLPWRKAP